MSLGRGAVALSPALSLTEEEILASSLQRIPNRLQDSLADPASLSLLHFSQWKCLASSYSVVLQSLYEMLDHARSCLESSEHESMCRKLSQPLFALQLAMTEGEACMQESLPSSCRSLHSWLVEKALPQSMSTEVANTHLHRLLCTFWVVIEQILMSAPPANSFEGVARSRLLQLTRELGKIWAGADLHKDFKGAQSYIRSQVMPNSDKGGVVDEEKGNTYRLAEFILQKLSLLKTRTRIKQDDALPHFLWSDSDQGLQRRPEFLGQGHSGKVQVAMWLGSRCAVKDFFNVDDIPALVREASIQAQLCHPNVLPLVCCVKNMASYQCSLVMERMEKNLRQLLMQRMKDIGRNRPFPDLAVAVDLMLQIARGMEYLHSDSLRIMHRDLKSYNILVSCSSRPGPVDDVIHLKVADFGLARAKYTSLISATAGVGTSAWRAPEVFGDNSDGDGALAVLHPKAKYTNKADVYSFGMVCYEILTGKFPFPEYLSGSKIKERALAGERPTLPSYCPPALSSYIRTCWDAEPARRPAFTHICRMLRYFKACILLLQDDHQLEQQQYDIDCDPTFVGCLLHDVSPAMCTRIDERMKSLLQQLADCDLQTQPVVLIPLEMYCCREILHDRNQSTEANGAGAELPEISCSEVTGAVQAKKDSRGFLARWVFKGLTCCTQGIFQDPGGVTYAQLAAATNNFATTSLLGKGGSGKVYFGMLKDGRRIVVKQADYVGGNDAMLRQELRIASQLQHPNVVPLFGWCIKAHGKLLLVYEYMPNRDLWQLILNAGVGDGSRVMEWEVRYKIVNQVATAIEYFHQQQIVHRDVKTCNIFLDSEGNARIRGGGLARLMPQLEAGRERSDVEGADNDTKCNMAGTRGYIAPEFEREGNIVSHPAGDIYAFGVTVLEIATGRKVSDSDLVEWVRALDARGELIQAADARLKGSFEKGEMERVLLVGLACTQPSPEARPAIDGVVRILSGGPRA